MPWFEFICIAIRAIMEESMVNCSRAVQFSPKPYIQHSQLFFRVEPALPILHDRNRAAKPPHKVTGRFPDCQEILPCIDIALFIL